MKKSELTLPEIALIAGTRGMLGAGAGLLLADRLNDDQRKSIGWTLLIIGAVSTIPLAVEVLSRRGTNAVRGERFPWLTSEESLGPDRTSCSILTYLFSDDLKDYPILDLACGDGHNGIFLALKGFSVVLTDSSGEALNQAKVNAQAAGVTVQFRQVEP